MTEEKMPPQGADYKILHPTVLHWDGRMKIGKLIAKCGFNSAHDITDLPRWICWNFSAQYGLVRLTGTTVANAELYLSEAFKILTSLVGKQAYLQDPRELLVYYWLHLKKPGVYEELMGGHQQPHIKQLVSFMGSHATHVPIIKILKSSPDSKKSDMTTLVKLPVNGAMTWMGATCFAIRIPD